MYQEKKTAVKQEYDYNVKMISQLTKRNIELGGQYALLEQLEKEEVQNLQKDIPASETVADNLQPEVPVSADEGKEIKAETKTK
jgi:hypothetical protein